MKSCLGLLVTLFFFIAIIGGGAMIWYLSTTAEFSRPGASGKPPVAIPVPEAARPARPSR